MRPPAGRKALRTWRSVAASMRDEGADDEVDEEMEEVWVWRVVAGAIERATINGMRDGKAAKVAAVRC